MTFSFYEVNAMLISSLSSMQALFLDASFSPRQASLTQAYSSTFSLWRALFLLSITKLGRSDAAAVAQAARHDVASPPHVADCIPKSFLRAESMRD